MIKANEVMIGNYFADSRSSTIIQVFSIEKESIDKDGNINLEPIWLTDEWIRAFGFDNDNGESDWSNYEIEGERYMCGDITKEGFIYTAGSGTSLSTPKRYVHEFQNLHYAITGRQLSIIKK